MKNSLSVKCRSVLISYIICPFLLLTGLIFTNIPISRATQAREIGHEIKVEFHPFKGRYIYLGHFWGKEFPIIDSALLNDSCIAIFRGRDILPGGIYVIVYPDQSGLFEFLIDGNQKFKIVANLDSGQSDIHFVHSPENDRFLAYQKFVMDEKSEMQVLNESLDTASSAAVAARLNAGIEKHRKTIYNYRQNIIKTYPTSLLAMLTKAIIEPPLPASMAHPRNRKDSDRVFQYYKDHFWDNVNFRDSRLAYTSLLEEKLDRYFSDYVAPVPDSLIYEVDKIMVAVSKNDVMTHFVLLKFLNDYIYNQKNIWEDIVFEHIHDKYINLKSYDWLTEDEKKVIVEKIQNIRRPAAGDQCVDVSLRDTAGKFTTLYSIKAKYVVVVFWDPSCSHCKEVLPKIDSFYQNVWKPLGVKVFSVASWDGNKEDWLSFINTRHLTSFTNVCYTDADDKALTAMGKSGYIQEFEAWSVPSIYLLDEKKKIIAKKLTFRQIDDMIRGRSK